ncbi:MAG: cyclic nucleotide-binding domain-containing protein [Bacteroidota bacterium]
MAAQRAEVLERVSFLQDLPRWIIVAMAEAVYEREYQAGEYVFQQSDPALGMYVVRTGRLVCDQQQQGTDVLRRIGQVGPGDAVGARALLGDFRRPTSAQATEPTVMLAFFRPALQALMARQPRAAAEIMAAIARHIAAQVPDALQSPDLV